MKYWLPAFVWMGLIFYFSSHSRVEVSENFFIQFAVFKSLHLIEYGLLYMFFYRALRNTWRVPEWQRHYTAFVIAAVYGLTDEIHQVFIPSREGKFRDVVIDAVGVSLAMFIIWKLLPKAPKQLKIWARKLQII